MLCQLNYDDINFVEDYKEKETNNDSVNWICVYSVLFSFMLLTTFVQYVRFSNPCNLICQCFDILLKMRHLIGI